ITGAYCHGDPHCQTFDGLYYDCHGDGDFVLLESADTGAVVHARFEPLVSPDASFTTGVAATEDGSSVIEVTVSDGERTILIDGEAYAYDEGDDLPATMTGVALTVTDQNVDMLFPSGLQVNARRWFTDPNYIGGVYVYAPLEMPTVGVLGTNNGNRADDWTDSSGETIDAGSASVAQGYNYCTSNWEAEESLLTTSSLLRSRRLQTSDYVAPVIPDVIPTDVEELCGDNTECIFDAIVVGLDVGAATLEAGEEFETEVQAAGGDVCEENTFSSDGLSPCTDCPDGETSGRGAVVCEGPLALGCYEDDREDRIMDDLALSDYSMTTEVIFTSKPVRASMPRKHLLRHAVRARGDADQTCGGFDAANVYRYTDESTPTSSFVGCYQDESDARIMELALTDSSSMTMEMCEAECTGNTFFGMQYGRECFCGGSSTDLLEHGESSACNYECPGDSDQVCGGFYAMSVYSYS
ncbi:unnamed protein product, partial [Ectocarpus sp. 6 AP-2014]